MSAALVLVGTPIGNLGDLSPRAVEELAAADVIACEDTRRTRTLLQHAGIPTPTLVVVNEHTEADMATVIVGRIAAGERVVLVSDAGMPAVSDPGQRLVAAAVDAGVAVEVVPGPSAVLAALVVSGLTSGRFFYEGFLPRKGSGRSARLAAVAAMPTTVVLFEAPHRLARTLADLAGVAGDDRRVAVARELTKRFEEVFRGTLAAAMRWADDGVKGEIVVVLEGREDTGEVNDAELIDALAHEIEAGTSKRDAVAAVTALFAVSKRRVYDLATKGPDSGPAAAESRPELRPEI